MNVNEKQFMNFTNNSIPDNTTELLSYGSNFSLPYHHNNFLLEQVLIDVKYIVGNVDDEDQRNVYRNKAGNIITNHLNILNKHKRNNIEILKKKRKQEKFSEHTDDIN